MHSPRWLGPLALCAALLGCGSTPTSSTPAGDAAAVDAPTVDALAVDVATADVAAPEDVPADDVAAAVDAAMTAGPYPEGPYGSREGTVLANLEWEGYVNELGQERSTALTFGPTSLQDLRGDGRGYALVHLAEFL
ncbi:MAG: hypothetical protein R3A48_15460 [Polyangiales bacterium]